MIFGAAISSPASSAQAEEVPPSLVDIFEAGRLAQGASSSWWKVVAATSTVRFSTPEAGLVDFARSERPEPGIWSAPAPATRALTFENPFELRYIDLAGPSRKQGFADFTVRVRSKPGVELSEVEILEATLAAGATREAGFQWRLRIVPQRAVEVSVRFHLGSLQNPRQVSLQHLRLWGRRLEKEETGEGG